MITESAVVDVSQDWAAACDLQERFMEVPYAKTQGLTYSARWRCGSPSQNTSAIDSAIWRNRSSATGG